MLNQEFLNELRRRVKLATYIGRRVRLLRKGKRERFVGLCPFHFERNPSFIVDDEKGFYHCFGCRVYGSVIGFAVRTRDPDSDIRSAIEKLANYAGIKIPTE